MRHLAQWFIGSFGMAAFFAVAGCENSSMAFREKPTVASVEARHAPTRTLMAYGFPDRHPEYVAWTNSARLAIQKGDFAQAEGLLTKVIKASPRNLLANRQLAVLYDIQGRDQKALEQWTNTLEMPGLSSSDQHDPIVLAHVADLCAKFGRTSDSLNYYQKAYGGARVPQYKRDFVARKEDVATLNEARAKAYWACACKSDISGTRADALRYATQAVSLLPKDPLLRYQRARDLVFAGKNIEAIDEFDRAARFADADLHQTILADPNRKVALMENTGSVVKITGKTQTQKFYPVDPHHSYFHGDNR